MVAATYYDNVAETTNTTGTGTLTLTNIAVIGSRVFPAAADGKTVIYGIKHSNLTDWEVGTGVYTNSGRTLTRVLSSSSTGSLLSLTGTGHEVAIIVDATRMQKLENSREVLTADRTYYVATTGSDSNDGLTVGTPFLTIQKAADILLSLDHSIYSGYIQLADGTYGDTAVFTHHIGKNKITIQGNASTPSNVHINTTTGSATGSIEASEGGRIHVKNLKISNSVAFTSALSARYGGYVSFENVEFGAVSSRAINAQFTGVVEQIGASTISGNMTWYMYAATTGSVRAAGSYTITLTGTPAWSGSFVNASGLGVIQFNGPSFSGSATGKRYNAELNGYVGTQGMGSTYFPGDVAGTTATGGQYY